MPLLNRRSAALKKRKSKRSPKKQRQGWFRRPLLELLEVRHMLDAAGFPGNDRPPDLNLDAVQAQTVVAGQTLSLSLFTSGGTLIDLDLAGNPTGDAMRVVLDPDVGTDTPVGAALTSGGMFTWTPTVEQIGVHTITVLAIDAGTPALADAETFTVRVVGENAAPNLAAIADQTATVGEELVVNVTAADANAGDALTFFLDPNDAPAAATIEQTSNTTATIRWTPQAGDLSGPTSFTVLVSDDGIPPLVDSESFSVTLATANAAPDLTAIADQTATVGAQLTVNVTATDADVGDVLTFTLDKDNGATPSDAIIQQTGNTTAIIRWTPDLADVGSPVPFRVLVTDSGAPSKGDAEDFLVTVAAAANTTVVAEGSAFSTSLTKSVVLGQTEGARKIAFDLEAAFDKSDSSPAIEDLFQVFLVDASDPAQTLLDNGTPGTAVFSLAGDVAKYQPGLVRYDGSRVEIDVTSLGAMTTANLVFQLINSDGDEGTKVAIGPLENTINAEALAAPTLALRSSPVEPAGTVDLTGHSPTSQIGVTLQNVRYDESAGDYTAELLLRNNGPATGRQLAIAFPGLPNDVTFENASGADGNGNPYVNMASAIGSGGLASGATSRPVTIRLSNPNGSRFSLIPSVLSGGANAAPTLASIAPIAAVPGDYLSIQLDGQDADGDTLTYTLSSPTPLPGGMLLAGGRLIFKPAPGQQGDYDFTVTVSDGVESVSRTSSITVETDPITTTRVSGVVLNANGEPLENVPVGIGGFTTLTAADGSFTIVLPTLTAPAESFNISVPTGDAYLDPLATGQVVIPFRRSVHDVATGDSPQNPRQHPNLVSSFIDASMVYGSDAERAAALRSFADGKLKVSAGDLLPLNDAATFPEGLLQNDNEGLEDPTTLFAAGDVRTNENVALIALHTVLLREHNRLADELKTADPTLTDDEIYQQARRLVSAIIQHITYSEYLPLLLGPDAIVPYAGYQSEANPTQSELFASAAFRVGHSQIPPEFQRLDENGQALSGGPISLQDAFFMTGPVKADGIEPYLRGLAETLMQEIDVKVIDDVRNFLFGPPGAGGMDLAAMNIQRGRDVGLPSYAQARIDFGLSPITSFSQITSDLAVQQSLQNIYGTVDKIDVWIGGLAENHAAGAMVGPLFQAILADQFQRTRDGDRFWYENGQLTDQEMTIVRGTTLESLIERNAPNVNLTATPLTTGVSPVGPVPAGVTAMTPVTEFRSIDGSDNNLVNPQLGSAGENRLRNFTNGYGDGVSTPGGSDRPGAREISNAVSAQSASIPNAAGATALMTFWGQLIDHDMGLSPAAVSDTLKIQGNLKPDDGSGIVYPFVAEKLPLVLEHAVYPGNKNVIARPIYLPGLDVAGGTTIDPLQDTMVNQEIAPGQMASVFVEAGSLKMDDGTGTMVDFTGTLSITEVPASLTPAALPVNLLPDTVVTIQPAEMVFTDPAELTLPNRASYPAGTVMDLWSINPQTGNFDKVGQGQVTADGKFIETISGGIKNSSWHLFAPQPVTPTPEEMLAPTKDANCGCGGGTGLKTKTTNSEVELFTGALREDHSLVTYQSLGQTRGLQLYYNSLHADPQPIVPFGYDNIPANDDRFLVAELELMRGEFMYQLPGFSGGLGLDGGEHFWKLPQAGGSVTAALQVDLANLPTGVYDYTLRSGLFRQSSSGDFAGTSTDTEGKLFVTNMVDSVFGAGWSLAGQQFIIENPDGSVLLLDGGGTRLVFNPDPANPGRYLNPPADFSSLEKLPDDTFRRTMTDQTIYQFNSNNQLVTMTDRNGMVTEWQYDSAGNLSKWIDPVGLETVLHYAAGKVTSIVDPAGRTTGLAYDDAGNLSKITDPDGSSRSFGYDVDHRMTSEIDQRGFLEQTIYGLDGRVERALLKDGGERIVKSVQSAALFPATDTSTPATAPVAPTIDAAVAMFADESGSTEETTLDRFGQQVSGTDAAGRLTLVSRTSNNLIRGTTDARGNPVVYDYDLQGNVTTISDTISDASGAFTLDLIEQGDDAASQLVNALVRPGSGINVTSNATTFVGQVGNGTSPNTAQSALYSGLILVGRDASLPTISNPDGILLTSGTANIPRTNTSTAYSAANPNTGSDPDLVAILQAASAPSTSVNNVNSISFQFTVAPGITSIEADFVFGSDEFPDQSVTDVFAFIIDGVNYAVFPDGSLVSFVRGANAANFNDNNVGTNNYRIEFDGLSNSLHVVGLLDPTIPAGGTHNIKIAIANTNDQSFDSGVFIGNLVGGTATQAGSGIRTTSLRKEFTYDPVFNQLTSFTDELGRVTLYEVDPSTGNRLAMREVVGDVDDAVNLETNDLVTSFTYTTLGLIDTMTDPLGRVTDYDYDALGRLTKVIFAVGTADEALQLFEYDTVGNQMAVVDENGNRTEFVYDSLNRLTQITEPDPDDAGPLTAPVTSFTYDERGNLATTTDARDNVTTNQYDSMNRLARTIDAIGQATTFGYDKAGNLARVTNPLGFTTHNVYDSRNRLVETTDAEGGVTQFAYDTDDNLVSVLDPVGNETLFRYDARDRLVQETDPLGATTVYANDAADNLIRKTDRNGQVTEFAYDALDRLTTETWLGDDGATAVNTITYAYDKTSNLLSVVDAFSALAFTYDNRDRVDTVDNVGTPHAPRVVLDYGYDGVGNVTSVADTIDGVAGATTGYAYDALNRTTTIQQSGSGVSDKLVDFVYNELGQFAEIARYSDLGRNNLVALSDYEYDELNRLTDLDHTNAADEILALYDFYYDPSSRITKITDVDGATDYSYDDRNQLTGADRDVTDARGDESYTYDANGNRVDSHLHGMGYVTGDGNRLLSDGTYNYEYDAEGHMTKRTEIASGDYREFEWDHRNRLIRVTDFSSGGIIAQEVEFAYDTLDRRIVKMVAADGAGTGGEHSTHFVYDRDDVLLDFVDADGSAMVETSLLGQRYLHGPGIDQAITQENSSSQWLLTDHVGSVRDVISNAGARLNHVTFGSYGDLLAQTDPTFGTLYSFTGREYDTETDLLHYRSRYYTASIGRFISEDTIGFSGGDANLFRYALNSPYIIVDPFGTDPDEFFVEFRMSAGQRAQVQGTFDPAEGSFTLDPRVKAGNAKFSNDGVTLGTGLASVKFTTEELELAIGPQIRRGNLRFELKGGIRCDVSPERIFKTIGKGLGDNDDENFGTSIFGRNTAAVDFFNKHDSFR